MKTLATLLLVSAGLAFGQATPFPPSGGGPCIVSGSATAGYVLTALSATTCDWETVGGASVDNNTVKNATYLNDTGTANTITGTTTTSFPGAYATGQCITFKKNVTNTGATTININSLGNKGATKNGATAMAAGNLVNGGTATVYFACYDGTQFQVLNYTPVAADIPTLNQNTTGNAATSTALAANGTNCSAGQFSQGVDASGNAEGCTALPTTLTGTANQITVSAATGAITLSIPTNPTLPGTTTGTFSGNLTGNASGTAATITGLLTASNIPKADILETSTSCSDAGSTDAYTCNLSPAITAYVTGTHYRFKANTLNTGAASINFNSVGTVTIVKVAGGITTTLATNDILAGQWVDIVYDGTNMQIQSTLGNAPSGSGSSPTCAAVSYSATPTFTVATSTMREFVFPASACDTTTAWSGNVTSSTLVTTSATVGQDITFRICTDGSVRTFVPPTNVTGMATVGPDINACFSQTFRWDGTNATAVTAMTCSNCVPGFVTPGSSSGQTIWQAPATGGGTTTAPTGTGTLVYTTGNIATATALAANGTNCSTGSFPIGVDASGNSESCTAANTIVIVKAQTPFTTKGDLWGTDGTNMNRLGVGTDGQALVADSASTNGWKWATISGGSGCVPAGSSTQILTDTGSSTCLSNTGFTYASNVLTVPGSSGSITSNVSTQSLVIQGGIDASANSALGNITVRGAAETGAGGSSSRGGFGLFAGGSNAATNTASVGGSVELLAGPSTGASSTGLQGLMLLGQSYAQTGTVTQYNLACFTSTAKTISDCGASPTNVAGVVLSKTGSIQATIAVTPSEVPVNASGAVTIGHTVCAGTTAGQVTDSGGTIPCPTGITIGVVVATTGTWPAFPDGTTFPTLSTTLPLIRLANRHGVGNGDATNISTLANLTAVGAITVTGHPTFEGVTSAGATGTVNLVFSASPTFTGNPIVPTQTQADNSTKIASTAYVDGKTAFTNSLVNTDSSLGTSTGSGLYLPGSSLTAGSVYYQASGGLTAAKADVSTTVPAVCIAVSTTQCAYSGTYRFSGSQSWTAGNILYVSDASAGAILNAAPSTSGHYVQRIGVALANDTIQFMPSIDVAGIQ